jgi:DNA ligase-1
VRPPRVSRPDGEEGPPLLLAHSWDGEQDLRGWWMSEKLDGVRAYWDGARFVSRLGNPFHAPDWFVAGLPGTPLDGELWGGRRRFQRTISIVRRQDRSHDWREVAYVVFDAPGPALPFEERLEACRRLIEETKPPHARFHEHRRCDGIEHLRSELARVEEQGGEGLMLRQPGSRYEAGRSSTLLKVKSFKDDEARVVEHLPGAGRHQGRLGALLVEKADGTRFSVGTGFSDAERQAPPALGAVITFRYQELSEAGVPRFPSFVGVRDDVRLPPAPVAASSPEVNMSASGPSRRFELVDGGSSKFWEIEVAGNAHTVRFGRIGTAGQSKTKEFPDAAAAQRAADALVAEKTKKGYLEVKPSS